MAINLVESVQQKLNIEELQKINPDTGEAIDNGKPLNSFYQLAVPAVLTGLYSFTRLDDKNKAALQMSPGSVLSSIFGDYKNSVISKIADSTGTSVPETTDKLEQIGTTSIDVVKENLSEKPLDSDVKKFFTGQRHTILSYLDPSLQLGKYIQDDTIDDSTNKMEGPVSNLIQNIGQIFSGSGNDQKEEI